MALPGFSYQYLGSLIQNVANLGDVQLGNFITQAGGRIIAPCLLNDSEAKANQDQLADLKKDANNLGAFCGGWFNGDSTSSAIALAAEIAEIVKEFSLNPIVLDLEFPYKDPFADRMPELLVEMRKQFPIGGKAIIVTSFGFFDRGMIWGGQNRFPSFRALKIRAMPQWYYNSPEKFSDHSSKYTPEYCMSDLKTFGATDGNLQDLTYSNHRGVSSADVHGLVEFSGVQEADLTDSCHRMTISQQSGFTKGFWGYVLERMPKEDIAVLNQYRGSLYVVP